MKHLITKSKDGTIKITFNEYSSVIIPTINNKHSVCVSCQIGCPIGCKFCFSGKTKFKRNLSSEEIIDQVEAANKIISKNPDSVVFMGMGEPSLNLKNVLEAASEINTKFNVSRNKITISTSGLQNLNTLLNIPFNIAISLHSPFDKIRKQLIPGATSVRKIVNFSNKYLKNKNNKKYIMIEYALIKDLNDSNKDLKKLLSLKWPKKTIFNLIEFNSLNGFEKSEKILEFKQKIIQAGYKCFIRMSRGKDIKAACGMLSNQ